jgi:hypothetical protein
MRLMVRPSWNKGRNRRYPPQLGNHHPSTQTTSTQGKSITYNNSTSTCILGYAVAQLVEALRYKSEDHGFDSRRCLWNFSLT